MKIRFRRKVRARRWSLAAFLAGAYLLLGVLWVLFSGRVALDRALGVESLAQVELYKGLAFISLSAAIIFLIAYRLLRRVDRESERANQSREALHRSEQRALAGLFAASLAHDGNNLLAVIRPNLTYVRRRVDLSGDEAAAFDDVERAVLRMAELFRRLRDAGRQKVSGPPERLRLVPAIAEAVGMARGHLRVKHCSVQVEGDESLELKAHRGLLEQLVINLVINAADATGGEGRIEVRIERRHEVALVEVHDDGPGVPPDQRSRIFEAFYSSKQEGAGIGLVSARACAESHGGRIEVVDSHLGGACFRALLPIQAEGGVPTAVATRPLLFAR